MLKDIWVDKVDRVDVNSADDINQVARAVIDLENKEVKITVDDELNESSVNPVQNKVVAAKIKAVEENTNLALDDASVANLLATANLDTIEKELKPNIEMATSESGQAFMFSAEAITKAETNSARINALQAEKADVSYVDEKIGDVDTALENIIAIQNSYIGGDVE